MSRFHNSLFVLLPATNSAPLFARMAESGVAVPMARGIDKLITAAIGDDRQRSMVKRAFADMSRSRRYLDALMAEGAMRHDLQGAPVERVSETHQRQARARQDGLRSLYERYEAAKKRALSAGQGGRPILTLSR